MARRFVGTDLADWGDIAAFDGLSQLTLSAWVKVTDSASGDGTAVVDWSGVALDGWALEFNYDNSWFVFAVRRAADGYRYSYAPSLPIGSWVHVACVYDGSLANADRAKIYINGSAATVTHVANGGNQYPPATLTTNTLALAFQNNRSDNTLDMAEVCLWSGVALSSSQVSTLYAANGKGNSVSPGANLWSRMTGMITDETATYTPSITGTTLVAHPFAEVLAPAGIASGEAFGAATLAAGAVAIAPAGLATGEAFGAATAAPGAASLLPSGIASAQALGSAGVSVGAATLAPAGLASAEAFGGGSVGAGPVDVQPAGLASAQALGEPGVGLTLAPAGLATAEAFGTATFIPGAVSLAPAAIPTAESLGTAALTTGAVSLAPAAIATGEAFGAATASVATAEFDVAGATYYAVAPAGYSYSSEQDTYYSTRKYTTLSEAEAALPATPTTPLVINIIGSWTSADTTAVTVAGVTTTAANYLLIRAFGSARHAGVWASDKYRLYPAGAYPLRVQVPFLRVDGLLIGKSSTSGQQACIYLESSATPSDYRVSNCVIRQSGSIQDEPGIYVVSSNAVLKVWNTIIYGLGSSTTTTNSAIYCTGTVHVYGCVLIGGSRGIYQSGGGSLICKNCYASGSTAGYHNVATMVTCASSDTSGSAGLQNIAHSTATFSSVTAGSQDYHLAPGSALFDAGTDTSADSAPLNFTTDIDGETRTFWSVGADDGALKLIVGSIASAEAFGSAAITTGPVGLAPAGIASAQALGAPGVGLTLAPAGLAPAEAFGSASLSVGAATLAPAGIASVEAFGGGSVGAGQVDVQPAGIASAQALGAPGVGLTLAPAGLAPAEAFGSASLSVGAVSLAPAAIPTAEAFGTAALSTGSVSLAPAGLGSAEAFGSATLTTVVTLVATGIGSAEAFGSASLAPGSVTLAPAGLATGESFGAATLSVGAITLAPPSIASAGAFGTATFNPGAVSLAPAAIPTAEGFGLARLGAFLRPPAISSAEAFGGHVLATGPVTLRPPGIAPGEGFGAAEVIGGTRLRTLLGSISSLRHRGTIHTLRLRGSIAEN